MVVPMSMLMRVSCVAGSAREGVKEAGGRGRGGGGAAGGTAQESHKRRGGANGTKRGAPDSSHCTGE